MTERYFPDGMPPPLVDGITLPWWQAAARHELVVQRCAACEQLRHPPAPVCPACRADESDWRALSGRGEVYTYTIVHRPIAAGQHLPFLIAVIALEGAGGIRMISNLVDVDPNDVRIGMPVEVVWEDMSDELAVPRFRPANSQRTSTVCRSTADRE